jgi:hypothetical protein
MVFGEVCMRGNVRIGQATRKIPWRREKSAIIEVKY